MFNRNLGPDIRFANIENNQIANGANRYQKVVGQNGRGKEFRDYFCPEQGLSTLNFWGGAEKVVVDMHWLTWLLWRPCLFKRIYQIK